MEHTLYPIKRLVLESHDLFLPLDHQPQGDRLHTTGRKLRLDLPPKHGGKLKTNQPVKNTTRLLGVDQIHVYVTRILDGIQDGVFCDLVENDSASAIFFETECLEQMP